MYYRAITIDWQSIFYHEAGPTDAPTLLPLHEPSSASRMFAPLFARLSDRFHPVAPDYPGFGHSDWSDPQQQIAGLHRFQRTRAAHGRSDSRSRLRTHNEEISGCLPGCDVC
jgi:pimeloyl-ACP methyl ester carboxylesterase